MMKDKQIVMEILNKRKNDAFNNPYQKFEYGRLLKAIITIQELVPPECFDSQIEEGKAATDAEIENWAINDIPKCFNSNDVGPVVNIAYNARVKGAKWMRDQSRLSEPSMPERDEQGDKLTPASEILRDELISFASRNDKYDLTNIRITEIPAYLEMLKKQHENTVDQYLNSKQSEK